MQKRIKVGLLGLGTVGSGVYRILTEGNTTLGEKAGVDLELKGILVRDPKRQRLVDVDASLLTTDPGTILGDEDIDIVVEVMGGEEPARSYIEEALRAGKQVVTANKEVMAKHGAELLQLARERGADLFLRPVLPAAFPSCGPCRNPWRGGGGGRLWHCQWHHQLYPHGHGQQGP